MKEEIAKVLGMMEQGKIDGEKGDGINFLIEGKGREK